MKMIETTVSRRVTVTTTGMTEKPIQTKFETDLQAYFPDIYKLHQLGKYDKKLWDAIELMVQFYDGKDFGEVRITYQDGKINHIEKTIRV